MPDSYGKRQRNMQKAKKFAAREERRAARKQQKADEAAGILPTPPEAEGDAPADEPTGELDSVADVAPAESADRDAQDP